MFNQFNRCFENLCIIVFSEYVNLRVRKVLTVDTMLVFLKPVLYRVHGVHLEKRKKISLDDVRNQLIDYEPHQLKKLVDACNALPYYFV